MNFFSARNFDKSVAHLLIVSALIGQGIGYSKVYLFHVVLVVSLFFFPFNKFILNIERYASLLVLLLLSGISLFWTENIFSGVLVVTQFGFGIYFLVYCDLKNVDAQTILKLILYVSVINLGLSLLESFSLIRYPFSQYSSFAPLLSRANYDWSARDVNWPTGFHWNPNNNGFFILIFTPLVLKKISSNAIKIIFFLAASFVAYMTASKLIFVAWTFFSFSFILIKIENFYFFKSRFYSLAAIAGGLITIVFIFYMVVQRDSYRFIRYRLMIETLPEYVLLVPEIILDRLLGNEVNFNFNQQDPSLHERLMYIDGIFKNLNGNEFLGLGAGTLNRIEHSMAGYTISLSSPHFYFFELWARFGIFFLFLYLWILLKMLFTLFKVDKITALALFLFLCFNPLVSSVLYFLPKWVLYQVCWRTEQEGCEA